jgi:dihydroneopterin aldolase
MQIFVEGLKFVGTHGIYDEEQRDGRRFLVDLVVDVGPRANQSADAIDTTVDYRGLADIVHRHGTETSVKLIETLGDNILSEVFERFDSVSAADLTIRKYATGVPGDPEWVGISMSRQR